MGLRHLSCAILLALGAICGATVGAILRRGPGRGAWLGFAVFGWAYFLLTLSPWGGEYGLELIEEVKRLQPFESIVSWRYGDTTDGRTREDMIERGAFALARRMAEDPLCPDRVAGHTILAATEAALDAALGTGEGA